MVPHPRGARGEEGDVGAALVLEFELAVLEGGAYLVVGDIDGVFDGGAHRRDLGCAEYLHARRRGGVVAVRVYDH